MMSISARHIVLVGILLFGAMPGFLVAQEVGRETGLPIPRYISLSSNEANMRRGPGTQYRIDWVYRRRNLPIQVIAESGNWRKVRDFEGVSGWFHYAMLSGRRTAIVMQDNTALREDPNEAARATAFLGKNKVIRLQSCELAWCEASVDYEEGRAEGWIAKTAIWGVGAEEIIED